MSIASRLRTAIGRKKRRVPAYGVRAFQREMEEAKAEGSSYPAINRALKGEVTPSVAFLEVAADVLGVHRAWLMAGAEPIDLDAPPGRIEVNLADFHAGVAPWSEINAWRELVGSLGLSAKLSTAVYDLAFTMMNAVSDMDVGDVMTLAGKRVHRPAPEYREAMRLELAGWHTFLSQWIEEEGVEAVRKTLTKNADRIRSRFARPF